MKLIQFFLNPFDALMRWKIKRQLKVDKK